MTRRPRSYARRRLGSPVCQSCGAPFEGREERGTEADGSQAADYCRLCYADGAFRTTLTMDDMVQLTAARLACRSGTPVTRAQAMLSHVLPCLARWRRR